MKAGEIFAFRIAEAFVIAEFESPGTGTEECFDKMPWGALRTLFWVVHSFVWFYLLFI